jgi:MoxR-like ATPase
MAEFQLTEKDFEGHVSKEKHGGEHLWNVLQPQLNQLYSITFKVQLFRRFNPLEQLWFWPGTLDRWYQTRLSFERRDATGCFVGLAIERPTKSYAAAKKVTDPDWARLERAVRQDASARRVLEGLFQAGYEARLQIWDTSWDDSRIARSLDDLQKALVELETAKGLDFLLARKFTREEVLAAKNQIELFMRCYREIKPIFERLVPDDIRARIAPSNDSTEVTVNSTTHQLTEQVADLLCNRPQAILQGAPGTGKTYLARLVAAHLLKLKSGSDDATHQALCDYQLSALLNAGEGVGEDPAVIAARVRDKGHGLWDIVQLHPSYSYEDFVRGLVAEPGPDGHHVTFRAVNRSFGLLAAVAAELAKDDPPLPVVLIVDEINRGDLSKVLGELIYALEYRGETVLTPYAVNGQPGLTVPAKNFYLIGTMNTADRSIALVDYAIRRRFDFVQLNPSPQVIAEYYDQTSQKPLGVKALDLFDRVQSRFAQCLNPAYPKEDVAVGHTYFLAGSPEELAAKSAFGVAPLLREYAKEGILNGTFELDLDGQPVDLYSHDQFTLMDTVKNWAKHDG